MLSSSVPVFILTQTFLAVHPVHVYTCVTRALDYSIHCTTTRVRRAAQRELGGVPTAPRVYSRVPGS